MTEASENRPLFEFTNDNEPAIELFAALHKATFRAIQQREWSNEEVKSLLTSPFVKAYLFQGQESAVGFAMIRQIDAEAEIITIGISPDHQSQGLGQTFLHQIISELRLLQVKKVFLEVREDNNKAIKLYKILNFKKTGKRSKYYQNLDGKHIDALTYKLEI